MENSENSEITETRKQRFRGFATGLDCVFIKMTVLTISLFLSFWQ